jgi:L-alanine-DL-glutamate epimerase-like enolase superfamily enzyme
MCYFLARHAPRLQKFRSPGKRVDAKIEYRRRRDSSDSFTLNEPFETSFGKIDSRLIFLVCLHAEGLRGWGEVVASEEPRYSYETVGTAFHVIKDFFGPALVAEPITGLDDLAKRLSSFRGHNMAKAGLELAYMDLLAQVRQQSLSALIGGTFKRVAVGVSRVFSQLSLSSSNVSNGISVLVTNE